ncbi:MAG: hypothetical protein RRZ92_02360 [Bacilli bacterium]
MKKLYLSTICLFTTLLVSCGDGLKDSNLTATLNSEFRYGANYLTFWNQNTSKNYYFEKAKDQVVLDFKEMDEELIGVYCKTSYLNEISPKLSSVGMEESMFYETIAAYITSSLTLEKKKEVVKYVAGTSPSSFQLKTDNYSLTRIFGTRNVDVIKDEKVVTKKFVTFSNYSVTSYGVVRADSVPYKLPSTGKYSYVDAPVGNAHLKLDQSLLTAGENEFYFDFHNNSIPTVSYKGKDCIKIEESSYASYENYNDIKAVIEKSKIGEEDFFGTLYLYLDVSKF